MILSIDFLVSKKKRKKKERENSIERIKGRIVMDGCVYRK